MKKSNHQNKHHHHAIEKRVARSIARELEKKIQRQRDSGFYPENSRNGEKVCIRAPQKICTYKPKRQAKLVRFLTRLRKETLINEKAVDVDLSGTTLCGASGTLLLLAEIDRINFITGRTDLIHGKGRVCNRVAQVFKQTQLDKKFNIRCKAEVNREDVKHWKHITDIGTTGQKAGEMLEELRDNIGDDITSEIYGAYVDAIDNVSGHAYEQQRYQGDQYTEQRWWVFAQIRSGRFITAACDLGMGIPRSLPSKGLLEETRKYLSAFGLNYSDQNLIKAAFELDRTKTAQKKHGKGLQKMRSLIDRVGGASLSIYSNSGIYRYTMDKDGVHKETLSSGANIMGTIVEWNIPIEL